jgi:acyl carrier protein
MNTLTRGQIVAMIRAEVSKYHDGEFTDQADFTKDLRLASDDLTEVAISLERLLGVKLDARSYREITNVDAYATAIQRRLQAGLT